MCFRDGRPKTFMSAAISFAIPNLFILSGSSSRESTTALFTFVQTDRIYEKFSINISRAAFSLAVKCSSHVMPSLRTQTYFRLSLVPPKITSARANSSQRFISVTSELLFCFDDRIWYSHTCATRQKPVIIFMNLNHEFVGNELSAPSIETPKKILTSNFVCFAMQAFPLKKRWRCLEKVQWPFTHWFCVQLKSVDPSV